MSGMSNIRTDCYLVKLNDFRNQYPTAHFEVVTYRKRGPLSPSRDFLIKAGIYPKKDGTKNNKIPFEEYKKLYIQEIMENPDAIKRLLFLKELSKKCLVFLVCYEKDAAKCHRSIVKELIEKL